MRKTLVCGLCLACITSVTTGCNNLSGEFRRDAAYTYNLLNAAENGGRVQKSQVEEGLAKAKAGAHDAEEQRVIEILELYRSALNPAHDSEVSRRFLEACRWEAAHALSQPEPGLSKPTNAGDCQRYQHLMIERDLGFYDCTESRDDAITSIDQELKRAEDGGRSDLFGKLYEQKIEREAQIEKNCAKKADAKVQAGL